MDRKRTRMERVEGALAWLAVALGVVAVVLSLLSVATREAGAAERRPFANCGERGTMIGMLARSFGEVPVGGGALPGGKVMVLVMARADGRSFTVLTVDTKRACVAMVGQGWRRLLMRERSLSMPGRRHRRAAPPPNHPERGYPWGGWAGERAGDGSRTGAKKGHPR